MINKISIENFKSISQLKLNCNKLNLITGTNSSGKSTFLQSMLLIKQNANQEIGLNGDLISVGDFREVKNFNISSNLITISTDVDNNVFCLTFDENGIEKNDFFKNKLFSNSIEYLSCNRIGAEDTYKKNFSGNMSVGINGEYTVYCLNKY